MFIRLTLWLLTAIFFLICLSKSSIILDPDVGWHLRIGEILIKEGVPNTDPFSYTMPTFPYVDHSWLSDYVGYLFFSIGGFLLFNIFYIIPALLSLILIRDVTIKGTSFKTLSSLLGITILFPFFAARPLVFSWLFFAILVVCSLNKYWKQTKVFIPIFFLVWANFHGSFVIGLLILTVKVAVNCWENKKVLKTDMLILMFSVLATFINPYGLGLWREALSSITDIGLRFSIQEWQPGIFSFDPGLTILVTLTAVFTWRYRKKYELFTILVFVSCLFASISSGRNIPYLVLISTPLFVEGLKWFFNDANKVNNGKQRAYKAYKVFFYLVSTLCIGQLILLVNVYSRSLEENTYPTKAVNYLRDLKPEGNIFSVYNWGGYLIWYYPEKKVFIDGRMPSWSQEDKGSEAANAFKDWRNVMSGTAPYQPYFEKYNVDTVLYPSGIYKPSFYNNILLSLNLIKDPHKSFSLTSELTKNGWSRIYQDEVAIIYTRPHN